jgi:hypothetical protein
MMKGGSKNENNNSNKHKKSGGGGAERAAGLFDVYYDISRESWRHLEDMSVERDALGLVDTDLANNYFDIREIVRLNPEVMNIKEIQKHIGSDLTSGESAGGGICDSGLAEQICSSSRNFLHFTQPLKIVKFFMELLVNYQSNVLLVSAAQAGKTRLFHFLQRAALQRN